MSSLFVAEYHSYHSDLMRKNYSLQEILFLNNREQTCPNVRIQLLFWIIERMSLPDNEKLLRLIICEEVAGGNLGD